MRYSPPDEAKCTKDSRAIGFFHVLSQMCKSDVLTHLLVLPFILPMLLLMSITTFLSHKLSPHWKPTLDIELTGSV